MTLTAGFWYLHERLFPASYREDIKETVLKTIKCGSSDLGYAKYDCLGCEGKPRPVFVCFTCKSRFCNKCGKKYTVDWSDKQQELILNVPHRHMVFTVPQELRNIFFQDRKKLNELSQQVAQVFQFYYQRKSKKRQLQTGIITVIHTFGRDLKFNPHIHALVTEGAMDNRNEWSPSEYIPYEYLRKSWQKVLLDLVKKWFPDNQRAQDLVNNLYSRYPKGFYVNAEKKMQNAKGAAKYIGRYLARPAIAEYRIEEYDGKMVTYWYEDHKTGKRVDVKQSAYRFLYNILQHIPPKHFRMVGRFGLYSRTKHKKAKQVLTLYAFMRTRQLSLRPDYHISVESMFYSVPYEYINQQVEIKLSDDFVEILFNHMRVASHKRLYGRFGQLSTVRDHMPDNHKLFVDQTPEAAIEWAESIGSAALNVVRYILDTYQTEKQALQSIFSLKKSEHRYTKYEIERACKNVISITKRPTVKSIQAILKNNKKNDAEQEMKRETKIGNDSHAFTRGASYYGGGDK